MKKRNLHELIFPQALHPIDAERLNGAGQLTVLGANGAGKSTFIDELEILNSPRTFRLSAISAFFPARAEQTGATSISALYRDATLHHSYMRTDAVSELDKTLYLLYADQIDAMFCSNGSSSSRLGRVKRDWEALFPGNRMKVDSQGIRFTTASGADTITANSLSNGEKAALYYLGAVTFAPEDAAVIVDSPTLFIHHSLLGALWNRVERLRPDCTFIYDSIDEDFVSTRTRNATLIIRSYDRLQKAWDYEAVAPGKLDERILARLAGTRRPMLFVEGDAVHSIDIRLYSLIFPAMTVRPLGSCNKVIETVRSLNDQREIHHLRSTGIVDRDRRTEKEVGYLRRKNVMVPEVAEVENIFLLPGVIKVMAARRGRDAGKTVRRISREVLRMFSRHAAEQALQHVRHMVKREVECKIDARFKCITALELHVSNLLGTLQPRRHYERLRAEFSSLLSASDYEGVLRVFNHKPMLSDCGIAQALGYRSKEEYIGAVLDVLKEGGSDARKLSATVKKCLKVPDEHESGNR